MRLSLGKTVVFLSTILSLALLTGCSLGTAEMEKTDIDVLSEKSSKSWEQAETMPLGKYPELVTYTLGQMKGANNSNLPDGQTYEDNAYTRYLKKTLNIQNKNVFMESEERYDEALNILVKDRNLPDIFLVSDRETLEELVENDLIEDLTEVYKSCASDKIKEMYESYGEELLASGTFDGKLYALPETAIDDGPQLLWLRRDWMEQLGLKEPKTLSVRFRKTGWVQRMVKILWDLSVIRDLWARSAPAIRWTLCLKSSGHIRSSGLKMQMEKLSMDR